MNSIKSIIIKHVRGKQNNCFRMTDHRNLNLKVNIHNLKWGSGYWKLNTQYLEDSEYKTGIKNLLLKI